MLKWAFIHRTSKVLLLLSGCILFGTVAQADNVTIPDSNSNLRNVPSEQLQQSYTWYDGDIKREIWLNPQLMAEFNPTTTQKNQISATAVGIRIANDNMNSIRFWRIDAQSSSITALQSISLSTDANPVSAVLHDAASTDSGMRALPGNIILYLNPEWDKVTVERWLKQKNLQVVSRRKYLSNVFVIKSKPGLDSLLKANSLYESGEVIAAFPNWWKELVSK